VVAVSPALADAAGRVSALPALLWAAGGWPINLALNEATGTLYVSDNVDSAVSYTALVDEAVLRERK
jgi:hypothetical protein